MLPKGHHSFERILFTEIIWSRFFRKLCSQIRMTQIPWHFSFFVMSRARRRLPIILSRQYFRFRFGRRRHWGHPCQKHPSTNTAIRRWENQKSGCPGTQRGCMRHPLIPLLTRASLTRISVERFPVDRTLDINALRSRFVRVSIPINPNEAVTDAR